MYLSNCRYEHMLEAWVSVLHETTNSFPDEFISKSAIQVGVPTNSILSDKMPRRVGFVNCFLNFSLALPWQQYSGQQGRYTGGTLLETFYKTYSTRHFVS